MPRLGNDAGIVPAAGQREGDGGAGQPVQLVDRPPGGNMVALGADNEHRHAQGGQADGVATHQIAPLGQIIAKEHCAQIGAVHGIGHAGGIGIPRHEIVDRLALAHQIGAQHPRPHQIV